MTQINETNLKLWQKELRLRFDLNQSTTTSINGREYDRNTLIKTFETLQNEWTFHLRLFKNTPLLSFIENGSMDLFKASESWADLDDLLFSVWVEPYFVERFREKIYKCSTTPGFQSINQLKIIFDSNFPLPIEWEDACFEKTFTFFTQLIKDGEQKYNNPVRYYSKRNRFLQKGIDQYINVHYFNVLKNLPHQFAGLRESYGQFAHSFLFFAFHKANQVQHFDVPSLKIFKIAAEISWAFIRNESARGIHKEIVNVIEAKEMNNWEALLIASLIYIVVFGVIYFLVTSG